MAKTTKKNEAEQAAKVVESVSKTEEFYNAHKKTIWTVIIAILAVGLCVLGYHKFIYQPKCAEAQEQVYHAEAAFREGNYELALDGDDNNPGFAEVAATYGAKAGEAVYFYAGASALKLERYEEAISWLKKYSTKDEILGARAIACMGDAYCGLEDYAKAAAAFEKAAAFADNVFAAQYLLKAGIAYEELGKNDKALACYEIIKDKYPQSVEGYDIDKYINRIK